MIIRKISGIPVSAADKMIKNGSMKDPYYRINEYEAADMLNRQVNVFSFETRISKELLECRHVVLQASGVDTVSEVFLNDTEVLRTSDMFRTYEAEVKDILHEGSNSLRFEIAPPRRVMQEAEPSTPDREIHYVPCGCERGNQYIRKAHSMSGWDWGIDLPDSGIYGDVLIMGYDSRIEDVHITQQHRDGKVKLGIAIKVTDGDEERAIISVEDPDGRVIFGGYGNCSAVIDEPKLWWPNNLGEQPLYRVRLKYGNEEKTYRTGLRTLTVSREITSTGREFCFEVNGVKFFAMGADYIPDDAIYTRITDEKLKLMVKTAHDSNFNMLRVWGGGYYPRDSFYDYCDEYGIVVWQDFMFACNVYDLSESFEKDVRAEAADNVIRLRHHASLGLWCGNNEMESAWAHWEGYCDHSDALKNDYLKLFEKILPAVVKEFDGEHFYWPSSPSSGGNFVNPDDENDGDTHYWAVWHGERPFSDYLKHEFNFCSEFGFQSFPSMKTVRAYAEAGDMNIFSRVMESHQKNDAANGKMLYYIAQNFRLPKDFENIVYVTQVLQALAVKAGVEHFRRHRGKCMGSLYWQLNDNWPVASWSSVDYFGRWKALQYAAARFYAPVAGSLYTDGGKAYAWLTNETPEKTGVKVSVRIKDFDFKVRSESEAELEVGAFCSAELLCLDAPVSYSTFIEAVFDYQDGHRSVETALTVPYKHAELKKASVRTRQDDGKIMISSDTYTPFVFLDFADGDAVFDNNCFDITDDRENVISYRIVSGKCSELMVKSLEDTY